MLKVNPRYKSRRGAVAEAGNRYIGKLPESATSLNGGEFLSVRPRSYAFVTFVLITLFVFWSPLKSLLRFAANSEFSYIALIPFISAYLVGIRRRYIFVQSEPTVVLGGVIVVCGILLLSLGNLLRSSTLADPLFLPASGIVTTWWGLFISCYGIKAARRALLPLGLLLFMVPAPQHATEEVIAFLQHGSAVLAFFIFRMIGVPAIRDGMAISLPQLTIEVAPECSGIRSSISLLILTLAGANLYLRSAWNKILLVSLLVPLSILKNAIRIVTLSTLAIYIDPQFLSGPIHHRGGILFFFVAFTMLVPIVILMRRSEKKKRYRVSIVTDGSS